MRELSDSEINEFIKQNYLLLPEKTIADIIGRSHTLVKGRMNKMELKKPKKLIEYFKKQSQIKKGTSPPNKGKKMPPGVYEKVKHTMFKKGIVSPNTKYDGYERITKDGYVEVRIRRGRFELKHRLLWQKINGKIPDKHVVVFKDRNKLNITINNLELITMHENALRNSIYRYPKELVSTIKLLSKLKKKIEHGKKSD